jgi:hypothetical protein
MHLQERINLLVELGKYMNAGGEEWQVAKERATQENPWFTPAFIDLAVNNIAGTYLQRDRLEAWTGAYALHAENPSIKNIGIVMAGNIPLVGFHDFLCAFISGHRQTIKLSARDAVLLKHLAGRLFRLHPATAELISFADMLKGCDAYIATGSNNSSRYFDYYFNKYPHIIRRNRSSAALLTGRESIDELSNLADDVCFYFGLGCRNVTKLFVPRPYDFVPLLNAFNSYAYFADLHKYKNNYDYQLTMHIMQKKEYMTNGSVLISENKNLFSPVSVLHYEYYTDVAAVAGSLRENPDLQCVVGAGFLPFGQSQQPGLADYADGVDTLQFLLCL